MSQFNALNALAVCPISTIERLLESARSIYCILREKRIREELGKLEVEVNEEKTYRAELSRGESFGREL